MLVRTARNHDRFASYNVHMTWYRQSGITVYSLPYNDDMCLLIRRLLVVFIKMVIQCYSCD